MRVMYKINIDEFVAQRKEIKKQKLLTVMSISKKIGINHNTFYNIKKNWEISRSTLKKLLQKNVGFTKDIID